MADDQTQQTQKTEDVKTQSQNQIEQNQNQKVDDKTDSKKKDAKPSIYADIGEKDPGSDGAATWSPKWREDLATGEDGKVDEKQLNVLKRYATPKDYHKSILAVKNRITSGEYKRAAMPEGDEAALNEWRKENGIPEKADGYEIPLPAGTDFEKLDDATKESINGFRGAFHKANLAGPQAKIVSDSILEIAEKQLAREAQGDAQNQETAEDTLRADWGSEYRPNLQMNLAYLDKIYGDEADAILMARTPDGRRLADIPAWNKEINSAARAAGGDVLITSEEGAKAGTIESRIAEIKKVMESDFGRYQRENLGVEYGKLLEKQEARGKL